MVQCISKVICMCRNSAVPDSLLGNLRKSRLKRCQKLRLQLGIDLVSCIRSVNISADILIEQNRILYPVCIFTEAGDRDIHIQANIRINHAERHRIGSSILVSDDFLRVEVIDSLIHSGIPAEAHALAKGLEGILNSLPKSAGKQRRRGLAVKHKLTGLRTDFHDLPLLYNDHALSVIDRYDGTIGNNIVASVIAGARLLALLTLYNKCLLIQRSAVEVLSPLIRKHRRCRTDSYL